MHIIDGRHKGINHVTETDRCSVKSENYKASTAQTYGIAC